MNRREMFKKLFAGVAVMAAAPQLIKQDDFIPGEPIKPMLTAETVELANKKYYSYLLPEHAILETKAITRPGSEVRTGLSGILRSYVIDRRETRVLIPIK